MAKGITLVGYIFEQIINEMERLDKHLSFTDAAEVSTYLKAMKELEKKYTKETT